MDWNKKIYLKDIQKWITKWVRLNSISKFSSITENELNKKVFDMNMSKYKYSKKEKRMIPIK